MKTEFERILHNIEDLTAKDEFSFQQLEIMLGRTDGQTINAAMKDRIESLKTEKRIGTMKYYRDCLSTLEKYNRKEIEFDEVTVE